MRKIITSDIFKLARLIEEADLESVFGKIMKFMEKDKSLIIREEDSEERKREKQALLEEKQQSVGLEVIMMVFKACCTKQLEANLYDLLGGIVEEDIANRPLDELIKDLKEIAAQNDIFNFFKQAGQLIG